MPTARMDPSLLASRARLLQRIGADDAEPLVDADRDDAPTPADGDGMHGTGETSPPAAAGGLGTVRQLRVGRQAVPLGVIGLLWSAGAIAAANPGAAALYLGIAVLLWWVKTRCRPGRRLRRGYRTMITVCGSAWLLVATTTGTGLWQTAMLFAGGYALAAPYWYRNRIPIPALPEPAPEIVEPDPEPEREPVVYEAPELDIVVEVWDERVAGNRGPLPNARLSDREVLPLGGVRYQIQLEPGVHTADSARLAVSRIASALGRSLAEVSVRAHPSGDQDRAVLLLTGRTDNLLARVTPHPGFDKTFDPETGYAGIGIHADGEWASWAYFIPDWGLASGGVFGDVGSGKSRLLDQLAAGAAHTGVLSVWGGDPTGGQAIPGILRHCAWPARSREAILEQLEAMYVAIDLRSAWNGLLDREVHVPTADEPGILLILDELHRITLDDWAGRERAVECLERIAREGRKAAVAVIVADQGPGLHNFGNKAEIRNNLLTRNAVCFRLGSSQAKQMLNGLQEDPSQLPAEFPDGSPTSGLGYRVGAASPVMRAFLLTDAAAALAAAPQLDLDETLANGIGAPWHNRRALAADSKAAMAARIAELSPAALAKAIAHDPSLADALERYRNRPRPQPPAAAGADGQTPAQVARIRIPPAPRFKLIPPPPKPDEPEALRTPAARRIYDLLAAGGASPAEIRDRTGLSESTVHAELKRLADAGLAYKPRHGLWARRAAA